MTTNELFKEATAREAARKRGGSMRKSRPVNQYIALLHRNGREGYGVSFPDFPGCVTAGRTVEEALREGAELLAFHVDGMRKDGIKIPNPRTLEAIREARWDWVEMRAAIVAIVPLPLGKMDTEQVAAAKEASYQQTITITPQLPDAAQQSDLDAMIDALFKKVGQVFGGEAVVVVHGATGGKAIISREANARAAFYLGETAAGIYSGKYGGLVAQKP